MEDSQIYPELTDEQKHQANINDQSAEVSQEPPSNVGSHGHPEIKALIDKSQRMSEIEARTLFDRYSENKESLSRPELVRLLMDVQQAFGFPPCVPNESTDTVLSELVLNVESSGSVSWIEFKSFCVYLQQSPIQHLHDQVISVFSLRDLNHAVLVSFSTMVTGPGAADVEGANSVPDTDSVREVLSAEFGEEGEVNQVFVHFHAEHKVVEAMIVFEREESIDKALAKNGAAVVQGFECRVIRYDCQRFPSSRVPGKHSKAASVIAKGVLAAKVFDSKHNVTGKVSDVGQAMSSSIKNLDESMRISETAQNIGHVVSQGAKDFNEKHQLSVRASQTASQINQSLHISETAGIVGEGVRSSVAAFKQTSVFQSGWGMLRSLSTSVSAAVSEMGTAVTDVKEETMEIVDSQAPRSPVGSEPGSSPVAGSQPAAASNYEDYQSVPETDPEEQAQAVPM
eukprot:44348_1